MTTIDEKIENEKIQNNLNGDVAKTSALSSGKIVKYEYFLGEKILPSD